MNKRWIEASHYHASQYLMRGSSQDNCCLEYLDVMGLFETGWMVYNFNAYSSDRIEYGYPNNE